MTESLAFALEQPHWAVVCVGHHDHAVTGRGGDGLTAGGHTAWHTAPGPVMTADVSVAVCLWKCSWEIIECYCPDDVSLPRSPRCSWQPRPSRAPPWPRCWSPPCGHWQPPAQYRERGRRAGGGSTCRQDHKSLCKSDRLVTDIKVGSYNPIIIFHRRKFLTMTGHFLTLTRS